MMARPVRGSDSLFHPLTQELLDRRPDGRQLQATAWARIVPGRHPLAPFQIADTPMVASPALLAELNARVADLSRQLAPLCGPVLDPVWGWAASDVLSLDFAVVEEPDGSWGLRTVEFQAFTSLVSSVGVLARIAGDLWPQTRGLLHSDPTGSWTWEELVGDWMAPPGSVLVEHDPWNQKTAFDFEATRHLFGTPIVGLRELLREDVGGRLQRWDGQDFLDVNHILNRVLPHMVNPAGRAEQVLADSDVGWHSHPLGYTRVSKALMPQLQLPSGERVARAGRWRELGLPAEDLVLKDAGSFGGTDVHLHVDAVQLDGLPMHSSWIVQPRYKPLRLRVANDGAPVFGEIRCVVSIRPGQEPWTAARLMRMYRGGKASAGQFTGENEGAGLAVLLAAP